MNMPSLVDPRLLPALKGSGYLPTPITIQANTGESVSDYGGVIDGWTNVSGLVALDGAVAKARYPRSTEIHEPQLTTIISTHDITLSGGYPQIHPGMRATDGTNVYDILVVWVDSQTRTTELVVRQVTT